MVINCVKFWLTLLHSCKHSYLDDQINHGPRRRYHRQDGMNDAGLNDPDHRNKTKVKKRVRYEMDFVDNQQVVRENNKNKKQDRLQLVHKGYDQRSRAKMVEEHRRKQREISRYIQSQMRTSGHMDVLREDLSKYGISSNRRLCRTATAKTLSVPQQKGKIGTRSRQIQIWSDSDDLSSLYSSESSECDSDFDDDYIRMPFLEGKKLKPKYSKKTFKLSSVDNNFLKEFLQSNEPIPIGKARLAQKAHLKVNGNKIDDNIATNKQAGDVNDILNSMEINDARKLFDSGQMKKIIFDRGQTNPVKVPLVHTNSLDSIFRAKTSANLISSKEQLGLETKESVHYVSTHRFSIPDVRLTLGGIQEKSLSDISEHLKQSSNDMPKPTPRKRRPRRQTSLENEICLKLLYAMAYFQPSFGSEVLIWCYCILYSELVFTAWHWLRNIVSLTALFLLWPLLLTWFNFNPSMDK